MTARSQLTTLSAAQRGHKLAVELARWMDVTRMTVPAGAPVEAHLKRQRERAVRYMPA
ncbi:MAG TPA: hypothetical protein VGR16_13235 [Thermomicrobiales bacterium]|nr:hypothetical protein [Thermomicrobiales bacterium]